LPRGSIVSPRNPGPEIPDRTPGLNRGIGGNVGDDYAASRWQRF
jgi:hypothetical protein